MRGLAIVAAPTIAGFLYDRSPSLVYQVGLFALLAMVIINPLAVAAIFFKKTNQEGWRFMSLEIHSFVLGPIGEMFAHLLADAETGVLSLWIPQWGAQGILPQIQAQGWMLQAVWLTHAHFDHTTGIAALFNALGRTLPVWLAPGGFASLPARGRGSRVWFPPSPRPPTVNPICPR